MVDIVLLFLLVLEWITIYILNGRTLFSPSLISCSMFLLTTTVFILSNNYFVYDIHYKTIIIIILSIFSILLGELYSNILFSKVSYSYISSIKSTAKQINIPNRWIFIILIYIIVSGIIYFRDVYRFSLKVGNIPGNYFMMAMFVRESHEYEKNIVISQMTLLSECLVYLMIYCFCYNSAIVKVKSWKYLLPVAAYSIQVFASDNRTDFLRTIIIVCIIFFVFEKVRTDWEPGNNKKIIMTSIIALLIFLFIFRLLGYRTGTSIRNPLRENLAEYLSASIVGLDTYLIQGEPRNILFGQGIFKGIYSILRQWGFNIPEIQKFESFYNYAGGTSNTYTALKAYIKDFAVFGEMLCMFLWGLVINYSINRVKIGSYSFIRVGMLGIMFYPIIMVSIEDVTATVLSMSTLYMMFYFWILKIFL